jgi:hypothetical protein
MLVGGYRSEGFGEIVVNPDFLSQKFFEAKNKSEDESLLSPVDAYVGNDALLKFLQAKKDKKADTYKIVELVNKIEPNMKGISNSQWGVLRSMCTKPTQANIEAEIRAFISKGKSKEMWQKGGRGDKLLSKLGKLQSEEQKKMFVKYLAMRMQSKGGEA